jgi:hypothetical protein
MRKHGYDTITTVADKNGRPQLLLQVNNKYCIQCCREDKKIPYIIFILNLNSKKKGHMVEDRRSG